MEDRVGRGTFSSGFGLVGSGKTRNSRAFSSLSDASLRKTTVRARRELDERVRGGCGGHEARVERVLGRTVCVWKVEGGVRVKKWRAW